MSDEKPPSRTELRRWAAGRGEEMPDFSDEGMRRCWQEHAEMLALLRELEWRFYDDFDEPYCYFCEADKEKGHTAECKLGTLLTRAKAPPALP